MDATLEEVAAPGVAPLARSEAGSWLCGRHPMLRELVQRIGQWQAGEPDMSRVRDAVVLYDEAIRENREVPKGMGTLIPSEVNRLRLLATLAPKSAYSGHLSFCVADLEGFDRSTGQPLVEDWMRCVGMGLYG